MTFDLTTINWEALAAIATFLAVVFALYQHRSHLKQREKEELQDVAEFVVLPLQQGLKTLLSNFDEGVFRTTQSWDLQFIKESNQYFYSRLPKDLREDMKQFDSSLKFFKRLSTQILPVIRELISHAIKKVLEDTEYKNNVESHLPDGMAYSYYKAEIGGEYFSCYISRLLRENISFDELVEKFFQENELPDKRIKNEEFIVQGINIRIPGRHLFIQTISKTRDMMKENIEVSTYIEKMRDVHRQGMQLKKNLDKFLENQN